MRRRRISGPRVGGSMMGAVGGPSGPVQFVSNWDTENTSSGSSTSSQIKLPLQSSGTYNFNVDWGDGSDDDITVYNQSEVTHTYSVAGEYELTIVGTITGFRFANTGDKLKILDVSDWGLLNPGNSGSQFFGCGNLTSSASTPFDITGVTNMASMFRDCSSYNEDLSSWDVSSVTTMSTMFRSCSVWNQDISGWSTGLVSNMSSMFFSCTAFNQDVSSWDVTALTNAGGMFQASGFNTTNYDALLIGWEAQDVNNSVVLTNVPAQYSTGAATTARAALVADHSWLITDLGQA